MDINFILNPAPPAKMASSNTSKDGGWSDEPSSTYTSSNLHPFLQQYVQDHLRREPQEGLSHSLQSSAEVCTSSLGQCNSMETTRSVDNANVLSAQGSRPPAPRGPRPQPASSEKELPTAPNAYSDNRDLPRPWPAVAYQPDLTNPSVCDLYPRNFGTTTTSPSESSDHYRGLPVYAFPAPGYGADSGFSVVRNRGWGGAGYHPFDPRAEGFREHTAPSSTRGEPSSSRRSSISNKPDALVEFWPSDPDSSDHDARGYASELLQDPLPQSAAANVSYTGPSYSTAPVSTPLSQPQPHQQELPQRKKSEAINRPQQALDAQSWPFGSTSRPAAILCSPPLPPKRTTHGKSMARKHRRDPTNPTKRSFEQRQKLTLPQPIAPPTHRVGEQTDIVGPALGDTATLYSTIPTKMRESAPTTRERMAKFESDPAARRKLPLEMDEVLNKMNTLSGNGSFPASVPSERRGCNECESSPRFASSSSSPSTTSIASCPAKPCNGEKTQEKRANPPKSATSSAYRRARKTSTTSSSSSSSDVTPFNRPQIWGEFGARYSPPIGSPKVEESLPNQVCAECGVPQTEMCEHQVERLGWVDAGDGETDVGDVQSDGEWDLV